MYCSNSECRDLELTGIHAEFIDGVTICPTCGGSLVESLDSVDPKPFRQTPLRHVSFLFIPSKGLRSLSWPFVICFTVIWNTLNLLAIFLNGGFGTYEDPTALLVLAFTCFATSALSFGIILIPKLRKLVTAEQRLHYFEPWPFLFIGALTGILGVALLMEAL